MRLNNGINGIMTIGRKKSIYIFAVLFLLLFQVLNNIHSLNVSPLAEGKDSLSHLTACLNLSHIFRDGAMSVFYDSSRNRLDNLIFGVIDYPPFFYASAFLLDTVLGGWVPNAALYAGTVFLTILLISVYKIGSRWGESTGLLAAFICSMYPMIFWASRHFSLELPLAAMTALSVWGMLAANCFSGTKNSVVLGIVLGLGMLTKQTFIVYVCGPLGIIIIKMFRGYRGVELKRRMLNALGCLSVAAFISLIYYREPEVFRNMLIRSGFSGAVAEKNVFSFGHFFYYPLSLVNTIGAFFTAVLLGAILCAGRIGRDLPALAAWWVLIPLCIFTLTRLKYGEYTVAYLPALALLSAAGINVIRPEAARKGLILLVIVVSLINFYSVNFAHAPMFYSTYYAENSRLVVKGTAAAAGDSVGALVARVNRASAKVGIFYDDIGEVFPGYFTRCFFSAKGHKAEIVDFYFRPDIFFKNMDFFDVIIFVTRSERDWIDLPNFQAFIDRYNQAGMWPLHVPDDTIARLINLKNNMAQTAAADFLTGTDDALKEKVFLYERRGHAE